MEDLTCKHCGTPITGKFCSECGQRYLTTPYSKEIISFLINQTIDFGANYFKTLWTLFINPTKVISTFLLGNVKKYVNPLKYLLLTVAMLIIFDWLDTYITNDPDGITESMELWIYSVLFGTAFYFILVNKLLWQRFKIVEHLIINIYLVSQMILVYVIIWIFISSFENLGYIEKEELNWTLYALIGMLIYYFYFNISVFHKRKVLTLFKSILILLIGFAVLMIGVGLTRGI